MTFVNEKSGTALVTQVLMPKLIRFRDGHFVYRDGRHSVKDIALSPELLKDPGDREMLPRLAEAVLALAFRAEDEKALRFEIAEDSVLRDFLPDTHVTGMTLLNLFTRGVLRLVPPAGGEEPWTILADPILKDAVRDAEHKLWILSCVILAYGNERHRIQIIFEPGELTRTERVEEDMSLTYDWDRQFDRIYIQGESPEIAETERERAVRLNREASLKKTLELIRVINEEATPEQKEEAPKHG